MQEVVVREISVTGHAHVGDLRGLGVLHDEGCQVGMGIHDDGVAVKPGGQGTELVVGLLRRTERSSGEGYGHPHEKTQSRHDSFIQS